MRVCRNSHKLKITLATGSCSEGDFEKRKFLTHLLCVQKKKVCILTHLRSDRDCPNTQSKLFSGEQTSPLLLLDNRCQRMPVSFYLFQECLGRAKVQIKVQTHG